MRSSCFLLQDPTCFLVTTA
uniref:Uncharacterized protein n=1 Tax=Anguilla anguilla TaxID=7936 RepID=A0A0E9TXB6_ANGAN